MITSPEEVEKVKKALNKKGLKYVGESEKHFEVIWEEDKTKYGHIDKVYYHRYGIRVLATFSNNRFWFKSNAVAEETDDSVLDLLSDPSLLSDFDISLLHEIHW
jgi:hypothetical protein